MTFRTSAFLAFLATAAAVPAAAEVRLGDQLDAIRLAGSERMMVHTLSLEGLPPQARAAREKLLRSMGLFGAPGSLGSSGLQFSPVMTHDSNINGGFASDGFTVAGIPFTIGEEYKAVGGLVIGISGSGRARISLGGGTALDLRAGGSIGYAPEHEMTKVAIGGSACVNHMFSFSTYGHACVDASYRSYDLGETKRVGGKLGLSHVMSSSVGVHELSAELQYNRHLNTTDYNQSIASFSVASAFPGPYAVTAGFQIGERVEGINAMRERVFVSFGFKAFDRPTAVSLSTQNNRGSMWLGEDRSDRITSIGVRHQISKKLTISASVSQVSSSAAFFDDTQYGLNVSWRF